MGINSNGGTQATIIDITPCNILTNIVYFKCHTPDIGTVLHRACRRENRYPTISSVRKNCDLIFHSIAYNFSLVQPLPVLPLGAVIAVAAVGAVLLLAVLVALLVCGWCCLRRRRRYEYSTGEYRVTVQTWNATNPIHYTVSKSGSFSSRMSSIRSSFGLKPKVLSNSYKDKQDHLYRNATTDIYSTPL